MNFQTKAVALGLKNDGGPQASLLRTDDPTKWRLSFILDGNTVRMQYYIGENFYNITLTTEQFEALDEHQIAAVATQVEAANETDQRLREQLRMLRTAVKSNVKSTLTS